MASWIIGAFIIGLCVHVTSSLVLPQDRLMYDMLYDYDNDAAPVINGSTPVMVEVDFFVQSLQEIIEKDQAVSLFLWVGSIWTDLRLTWDPELYDNVSMIVVHGNRIWTPDLVIRNSLTNMYEYLQNEHFRAIITHTGLVRYWIGGSTVISCSLDLTFFPYDTQSCYVHVNSWSYVVNTVRLQTVEKSLQMQLGYNSQWDILQTNASVVHEVYNTGNAFDSVMYCMVFQRKPAFYTRNIIFPCILLSVLALLMFSIPIPVGDRISYGITVLLSFTVFQLMIADSLPRTSDQLPFVITYLMAVMLLTATCIIFSVIVLNIQCQPADKPVPGWFHVLTFTMLSRLTWHRSRTYRHKRPDSHECNHDAGGDVYKHAPKDDAGWQSAADIWDRFFFVIFGLVLLATSIGLLKFYPDMHNTPKGLDDYVMIS